MATREDAESYLRSLGLTDQDVIDYHAQQLVPDAPEAAPAPGASDAGNAHSGGMMPGPRPAPAPAPVNLAAMFPQPPSLAPSPAPKAAPVPWNAPKATEEKAAPPMSLVDAAKQFAQQDKQTKKQESAGAVYAQPSARQATLGPMISRGGRTPHSWTVQEGIELPETVAAYGQADRSARDAAGAARDAGELDALRQMGYLDRFEKAQEERANRLKWEQEDRQRRIDAELDKYSTLTDRVRSDKIDPSAFFTKRGTAGAFAASIAYALGAVGGALTHTENPVIGVIREEIQAQKDNATLRRQKLEDQRSLLGQLTKSFGDEAIAEQAAWGAYLEKAKVEMQRIAADSQYDSVRAKYKQAVADIDAHLAPTIGKLEELMANKTVRQDVNAPAMYAGSGLSSLGKSDARYLSEAYEKAGIPQLMSELENADRVVNSFGKEDIPGIGLVTGKMPVWMLSERGAAARQAIQGLKNAIGHARFGGALSPGEAERLDTELDGAKDANSIKRTIQAVRSALQKRASNIAAGSSPEGVDYYEARGGSVQRGATSERQVSTKAPTTPFVRPPE